MPILQATLTPRLMFHLRLALDIARQTCLDMIAPPHAPKRWAALGLLLCALGLLAQIYGSSAPGNGDGKYFLLTDTADGFDPAASRALMARMSAQFVGFAALMLGLTWTAIAWHRYVLRERLSQFSARTVLRYIAMALPISLVVGGVPLAIASVFGAYNEVAIVLAYWAALYFAFRISPALPAAAVGGRMRYGTAWRKTGALWQTCALLAALEISLSYVLSLLDRLTNQAPLALDIAAGLGLTLFEILFAVGLITRMFAALEPAERGSRV